MSLEECILVKNLPSIDEERDQAAEPRISLGA